MTIDGDPTGRPDHLRDIKQATLEDLDAITDLQQPVYTDTYPNDRGIRRDMFEGDVFRQHMRDYLEEQLADPDRALFMLRDDEGEIVGTIGICPDKDVPGDAEIWGFYVDTTRQGEGFGKALWEYVMNDSRSQGIRTYHLTVAKDAERAIKFYETNGFRVVGEEEWDWPNWTDEVIKNQYWRMEKQSDAE